MEGLSGGWLRPAFVLCAFCGPKRQFEVIVMKISRVAALTVVFGLAAGTALQAGGTNVAVAANFTAAAPEIARALRDDGGHSVRLRFGASGTHSTRITQGGLFDVFFSADSDRPAKLLTEGQALVQSRFTDVIASLVLWSRDANLIRSDGTLREAALARQASSPPRAAPCGAAAVHTLRAPGLYEKLQPGPVEGAGIGQAFQLVDTSNAEAGFVALAEPAGSDRGSRLGGPQEFPIRQDAALLQKDAGYPAATAFPAFLKGQRGRAVIARNGTMTATD